MRSSRSAEKESAVNAHLCEVLRLVPPQELDRDPTWFSADKAKRRLHEHRTADFGTELARVVDRAVSRIRRSRAQNAVTMRALQPRVHSLESSGPQKVQFIDIGRVREAAGKTRPPRVD